MRGIDGNIAFGFDAEVAAWVAERIPGFRTSADARALGVVKDGALVAGVVFERWNGVHVEASIAADHVGWADRATLRALFAYPFEQLGVLAISVTVPSSNLPSLNLATKLGFEPEALVKFAAHDGSTLIILKMFREKCRWIGDHGQQRHSETTGSLQDGEHGSAVQQH